LSTATTSETVRFEAPPALATSQSFRPANFKVDSGQRLKSLRLGLDSAFETLGFAEVLFGMLASLLGISARLLDIRGALPIKSQLFTRIHFLPAFRFSMASNSSSMRL
jgi:hypothetical protein